MQKVGLDTGFFFELIFKNEEAIKLWEKIINQDISCVISSIVLFELKRLSYKKNYLKDNWKIIEDSINNNCNIVPITKEIAIEAAGISHGTGLPTGDALIYATYKITKCNEIYTVDNHFLIPKSKNIKVKILK